MADATPDPLMIVRRRSHTLVYSSESGDPDGVDRLVKKLLLWDEDQLGRRWVDFRGYLYDVDPKGRRVLRIPANVPEDLLKAAFPLHDVRSSMKPWDVRRVRVGFRYKDYPPKNNDQVQIIDFLTRQGKFAATPQYGNDLVVAPTSAGKSYTALSAWSEFGNPLFGVFAQSAHLSNFLAELNKFTDVPEDKILVLDGNQSIERALRDKRRYTVTLGLHRTIWNGISAAVDKETQIVSRDAIPVLRYMQENGVGTLLFDEAHLEIRSLYYLSLMANVERTIYLTATAGRTDNNEGRMLRLQLPTERALYIKKDKRVDYVQVAYRSSPDPHTVAVSTNRKGYFDVVKHSRYVSSAAVYPRWVEMIAAYVRRELDSGSTGVGVVVGGELPLVRMVIASMREMFPGRTVGNFTSDVKKDVRNEELDRDIIVTTEKSFGGSVNPERMDTIVFLAPLSSKVSMEQISGRLRGIGGKPCKFYDIAADLDFPKMVEQAKNRKSVMAKLAKTMSDEEYSFV